MAGERLENMEDGKMDADSCGGVRRRWRFADGTWTMKLLVWILVLAAEVRDAVGHSSLQCVYLGQAIGDPYDCYFKDCFTHGPDGPWTPAAEDHQTKCIRALNPLYDEYVRSSFLKVGIRDKNERNKLPFPYHYHPRAGYIDQSYYDDPTLDEDKRDEIGKYNFDEQQSCPYNTSFYGARFVDPCPTDEKVKVHIRYVKEKGRILNGWLHFAFDLTDTSDDEIVQVYVQVRDEFFNAIGEFIVDEQDSNRCPKESVQSEKDGSNLPFPTKYQVFPCGAVGYREPKASYALFMARRDLYEKDYIKNNKKVIADEPKRGIQFTWRLSEFWCNRHVWIRPDAFIYTRNQMESPECPDMYDNGYKWCRLRKGFFPFTSYRKAANYWFRPKWFGAADIKRDPDSKLDCSQEAIDLKTGAILEQNAESNWLQSTKKLIFYDDFYADRMHNCSPEGNQDDYAVKCGCQTELTRREITSNFGGRCRSHREKKPNSTQFQGCNLNVSSDEFQGLNLGDFEPYTKYTENIIAARKELCRTDCRNPTDEKDLEEIKNIGVEITNVTPPTTTKPKPVRNQAVTVKEKRSKLLKLWQGRKFHGIMCVLFSMFLMPVALFSARYYKETFMKYQSAGVHVWYWLHLGGLFYVIVFYASGHAAMYSTYSRWGRSDSKFAVAHRAFGYLSIVLFSLMFLLGGYRPLSASLRIIVMTSHAVLGFLIYFLNYVVIILSAWIPASPTLNECRSGEENGWPEGISDVVCLVLAWMVIDLAFHIGLTVYQFVVDTTHGVIRPWRFPIVPILPPTAETDYAGATVRKICFLAYIIISFCIAVTVMFKIGDFSRPLNCRVGTFDCPEVLGCDTFSSWRKEFLEDTNPDALASLKQKFSKGEIYNETSNEWL